ncbi:MAG: TolC family protein [Spirochaetes bacterium]|nr:MAG: TolC family protein [Spirochaetota bacterium]
MLPYSFLRTIRFISVISVISALLWNAMAAYAVKPMDVDEDATSNISAPRYEDEIRLDLENSLGIAINNSIDLKSIGAQERVRDCVISQRWRDFFPTLSVSYMQTEEARLREADSRQYRFTAESNLVVYDGGQKKLAYDVAKLQSILARNDYRIAVNRLIADTGNSFFSLLQQRDAIAIHKKTLVQGQMQLKFISKELELGEATRFDRMEIEAKVKEIELNLEKAKDDFAIGLNKFKLMLRMDWRQRVALKGDIEKDFIISRINEEKHPIDDLIVTSLRNRKEIDSADVEFMINQKKYLMSKYYYFPEFSLGASYSLTDDRYFPREQGWGVNFKVTTRIFGNSATMGGGYTEEGNKNARILSSNGSVNLLDRLDYEQELVQSSIDYITAKYKKKEIRQQIALEVATNYSALINGWKMIEIAKQQLELYDAQLEIERLKANLGDSRRYDLIKKEIERGESALSYLNAIIRYLQLASTFEIALGVDVGFLQVALRRNGSTP